MPERGVDDGDDDRDTSRDSCARSLTTTLLLSLSILLRNPKTFLSIFALLTLPLSLLLFLLSVSAHPLHARVLHLEVVAAASPTRFEARHIWKESRDVALSLLRLKAIFALPCFILSLITLVVAVSSAAASASGRAPSLRSAVADLRLSWRRPLVTSICVYAITLTYSHALGALVVLVRAAAIRLAVAALGAALEVYLMAVLSLGLVVSVLEDREGLEAIRVGSAIMEGRRLSGWVLSGLLVLLTGCIGLEMEELMEGGDLLRGSTWTPMWFGDKAGLVCLFGLVVVWGYVGVTVFYCECRKRHICKEEEEPRRRENEIELAV